MTAGIHEKVTDLIGHTPLIRLNRISEVYGLKCTLLAKLEGFNPSGSVKDRSAMFMIASAVQRGDIRQSTTVIDPSAGNAAISTAMICASLGLHCIVVTPDNLELSRKKHISIFGAQIVTVAASRGMNGIMERAHELAVLHQDSFLIRQFENDDNCQAHRVTTAAEILQFVDRLDYFVAGAGTCGTVTGCGETIKKAFPTCKIVAVEPVDSPVLSGGFSGAHSIAGIGAGFVPQILNEYILDEVIRARTPDSIDMMRELAKTEGIFCGISSGAALCAAISIAQREEACGKTIVVLLPDNGDRYLNLL